MASPSTWIPSLKALLISTGVLSIAIAMKFSVPLIMDFVPIIWSSLLLWLKPPYLYVIINCIIITIAASSRFRQDIDDNSRSEPMVQVNAPPSDLPSDFTPVSASPEFAVVDSPAVYDNENRILDVKAVVVNGSEVVGDEDEDEFVISRTTWTPPKKINSPETQTEYLFPTIEKPLVSSRFGHRKPVKASPEGGRALRVAKPRRNETLESTWKTITDGRHMPLTRHLRKSDAWENHGRQFNADRTNYSPPSSTLVSTSSPGSAGKLRKETSLSQDELNRRVEAFIKKFNEEMRLQRQESLNQYMEMINRGAH